MGIVEDIVTPKKNYILRMWLFAGAFVLLMFAGIWWQDRFRANCEAEEFYYGLLGVEQYGEAQLSFSGDNFFVRARKMGLGSSALREVREKLAERVASGEISGAEAEAIPVLWLYAYGKSKAVRDESFRSRGELFFRREHFCLSLVDESGFRVQQDPEMFTVFRAETGEAICAIPLTVRPRKAGKTERFFISVESCVDGGTWRELGRFWASYVARGASEKQGLAGESKGDEAQKRLKTVVDIRSRGAELCSLVLPRECRFYSSALNDVGAFASLELKLPSDLNKEGWELENLKISESCDSREVDLDYRSEDVFHRNIRFVYGEDFGVYNGNGNLCVPIAKVLFPSNSPWQVSARLVRKKNFKEEELHYFSSLKITKSGTNLFFSGERVRVRAFLEEDYFRLLANGVPALVLEIAGEADSSTFWHPYRVKTDKGEDLNIESTVVVRPGVYQYWFMPRERPKSVDVTYAISAVAEISAELSPKIREPGSAKIP